jgi:hypothetical protein
MPHALQMQCSMFSDTFVASVQHGVGWAEPTSLFGVLNWLDEMAEESKLAPGASLEQWQDDPEDFVAHWRYDPGTTDF